MDHLKELCEDLEIEGELPQSDEGTSLLAINDELAISVKDLEPGMIFFSPIAICPEEKREDLLIQIMKANLFGQGTRGAAIGFDGKENLLTLSLAMPYEVGYREFRETFEDFANIVKYWRDEVSEHVRKAQSEIL